ncbi:hypothetical protein B0H14DRAFT_2928748 [Mycena olivaceomarginata]|nr:hypothetical protein B0H14DRAFT_2928748 [Mycena olivaceomarginata]
MDITAAPITSPTLDEEDLEPASLPILPALASAVSTTSLNLTDMDVDTGSSCDDEYDSDSDGYSSGDSDIDLDTPAEYGQDGRDVLLFPPTQPLPSPPTMPPPLPPTMPPAPTVSHTLPPAPIISPPVPSCSSRSPSVYSPPIRTKYTCLPSPLSPDSDACISYTNPLRHAYGHHGRSRHALLHLKYLWAMREDQWDEHAMRMHESYAYDGVSPASARHAFPSSPPPPRVQSPDYSHLRMPPLTIHPRRGDLSALRDPYCAHMDRCFVGMPLWTMGKTLWMYDVHVLAGHRVRLLSEGTPFENEDEESGSEGENSTMASSMSTAGFSDDSDETLVDSERSCSDDEGMDIMEDVDLGSDAGKETDGAVEVQLCSRPLGDYLDSKPRLLMSRVPAKSSPPPRWETTWYKRFEVLIELVRLDTQREMGPPQQQRDPSSASRPSSELAVSIQSPRSRFFIGGEEDCDEDWDGSEGDDSWSEERWDQVLAMDRDTEDDADDILIVSNPVVVC